MAFGRFIPFCRVVATVALAAAVTLAPALARAETDCCAASAEASVATVAAKGHDACCEAVPVAAADVGHSCGGECDPQTHSGGCATPAPQRDGPAPSDGPALPCCTAACCQPPAILAGAGDPLADGSPVVLNAAVSPAAPPSVPHDALFHPPRA